jgi:predicted FMN-binding regulatory protein PaiB
MYLPAHFAQRDPVQLQGLMREHPLATLITLQGDDPMADALPLHFDASTQTLRGHVARANPLWQAADGQRVLAVFHGPQAYVTPNWYPSKAATHKVVPTWNYALVQARGVLRAVPDAPWLHGLVSELTQMHEAAQPRLRGFGQRVPGRAHVGELGVAANVGNHPRVQHRVEGRRGLEGTVAVPQPVAEVEHPAVVVGRKQ